MAEIHVEQRKGGLGWLWLLIALIVIGAAVWYFLTRDQTAGPADTTRPAPTSMYLPASARLAAA